MSAFCNYKNKTILPLSAFFLKLELVFATAKEIIQIQEVVQPKEVNVGKWEGQDFSPL